jgi:hypothetical protein
MCLIILRGKETTQRRVNHVKNKTSTQGEHNFQSSGQGAAKLSRSLIETLLYFVSPVE